MKNEKFDEKKIQKILGGGVPLAPRKKAGPEKVAPRPQFYLLIKRCIHKKFEPSTLKIERFTDVFAT